MSFGSGGWGDDPWGGGGSPSSPPTPPAPPAPAFDSAALQRELGRLFGTDLFFENDYAIDSKGDFVLLSGLANLKAAIYRRMITRQGEYKFVPGYGIGLPSYIKRRKDVGTLDQLKIAIQDQLLQDPRIDSVDSVVVESIDNGLKIGLIVTAAGRALRFRPLTFTEEQ